MKVVGMDVSFLIDLVSLKNDFYILSYDENTPSRSWWNFTKIQHKYFEVNPKLMVYFKTLKLEY